MVAMQKSSILSFLHRRKGLGDGEGPMRELRLLAEMAVDLVKSGRALRERAAGPFPLNGLRTAAILCRVLLGREVDAV